MASVLKRPRIESEERSCEQIYRVLYEEMKITYCSEVQARTFSDGEILSKIKATLFDDGSDTNEVHFAGRFLSLLCDSNEDIIRFFIGVDGLVPRLLHLCQTVDVVGPLWAISSFLGVPSSLRDRLKQDMHFLAFIKSSISCCASSPEEISAALWTVHNVCIRDTELKQRLSEEMDYIRVITAVLSDRHRTFALRRLASWVLRSFVDGCPANQLRAMWSGALVGISDMLSCSDVIIRACAAQFLEYMCVGQHCIQKAVNRLGLIEHVVSMLDIPVMCVKVEAASALFAFAFDNPENQSRIAELGGVEKLAFLLRVHSDDNDAFMTALSCLLFNHPQNQAALASDPSGVEDLCMLLTARIPRVRYMAAMVIRMLVLIDPLVSVACGAHGAIPKLVSIITDHSTPNPHRLQVLSSLHALTARFDHCDMMHAICADSSLASLFCTKILSTAVMQSLLSVLAAIGLVVPATYTRLSALQSFVEKLTRLAHRSSVCAALRSKAKTFLRALFPVERLHELKLSVRESLLNELQPHCDDVHECCICLLKDGSREKVYLPCLHVLHATCIRTWVLDFGKDECPVCKAPVLVNIQKLLENKIEC